MLHTEMQSADGDVNALTEEKSSGAQQLPSSFNLKRFLGEVNAEMKKVSWSNREELISYTCVVGIAVAIVCALIWICDTGFARLFKLILS